ncbi:MAG: hypothetical protein WED06_02560 [Candidatus Paceibacterota bacterium]
MPIAEYFEKDESAPGGGYKWVVSSGTEDQVIIKKDMEGKEVERWTFKNYDIPHASSVMIIGFILGLREGAKNALKYSSTSTIQ